MPHCLSPENCLPLIGRLRRHPRSHESRNDRQHTMAICSPISACTNSCVSQLQRVIKSRSGTIHDLDDDSLLHIFYLFQPSLLEADELGDIFWNWDDQRWWYNLVQVCRRWRGLILGSASYLRLRLVCTTGIPVADMLAHSPPFPLIIGYNSGNQELTAEDEEGIRLALLHRDRVRFIYLRVSVPSFEKLLPAMDDEFPALEYLSIGPPAKHDSHLTFPPTFEAPHLRRFTLAYFASQIGSPLLSTATGLVVLSLEWIHPSPYPLPNKFIELLSLLPHLQTIFLSFCSSVPDRDIENQMLQAPITMHVLHPNLRLLDFKGDSNFIEAILPRMAAPLLEMLRVQFFNPLHFPVSHLAKLIMNTEKLRSRNVVFTFHREAVILFLSTSVWATLSNLELTVSCRRLDQQVSSATQISNALRPLLSDAVDLTLDYREHTLLPELQNEADHTQWREILGSFRNVKTLRLHNGLVGEVSRCLGSDEESPLEILPNLKELICPTRCADDKTFAPFIREREVAGQPVSLIGEKFPAGRIRYTFYASTGNTYIEPD